VHATGTDPWRSAIAAQGGLSPAMLDLVMTNMAAGWTERALEGLLIAEFGGPRVPVAFAEDPARPGVLRRPVPDDVAFHVLAGNVPGVGITAAMRALLVGTAVFARAARSGSLLPALFARMLEDTDAGLARCFATTWWEGADTPAERAALARTRLAVVYGGGPAVEGIRARAPANARVLVHGPAVSVGVVLAGALARDRMSETARSAALAVATFDQRGCTSPVALLVERGAEASPAEFCRELARRLEELGRTLPPGPTGVEESARRRQVVEAAALRGSPGGPEGDAPGAPIEGSGFCIIPARHLDPEDICTGRVAQVVDIAGVEEVVTQLRPLAGMLQTVGFAAGTSAAATIADDLTALGVSRITSLGAMPWPPPAWSHDGASPLRELVRWADLEDG
jgi:hypothetical protein